MEFNVVKKSNNGHKYVELIIINDFHNKNWKG